MCVFVSSLCRFDEFIHAVITRHRGGGKAAPFEYDAVSFSKFECARGIFRMELMLSQCTSLLDLQISMHANDLDLKFPHQLFINSKFVDAAEGRTFKTINPFTEEVGIYWLIVITTDLSSYMSFTFLDFCMNFQIGLFLEHIYLSLWLVACVVFTIQLLFMLFIATPFILFVGDL